MAHKPFGRKVWLASPTMHGDELKYMTEAYETNWMSTIGENINTVEKMICNQLGVEYAVGLASGTAALHMAVKLAGVKPGDHVFCSDVTFAATVNPVAYEGGIPIFNNIGNNILNRTGHVHLGNDPGKHCLLGGFAIG